MAFEKGNKLGIGKPKGAQNKTTVQFKEAVTTFIESNHNKFNEWLELIDSPAARFEVICKLAEYAYPKLARQELTGLNGNPIEHIEVTPEQRREALRKRLGN
jgi:hypothetical protein